MRCARMVKIGRSLPNRIRAGPTAPISRRITSEFVEGFDALAGITKGVTIFGSARTGPDDPQYEIKSDKTDHIAAHKGRALTLLDD